jgi:hypothetical protein
MERIAKAPCAGFGVHRRRVGVARMGWPKLSSSQVRQAIEIYLAHAYSGPLPSAVRGKLETLHSLPEEELYDSPLFERDVAVHPSKLSLRLGNKLYPHMKLTIERTPDGQSHLFRADTHDRHIAPQPGSRDYAPFMQLMDQNHRMAQAIETAWAEANLPTFKTYLRDDLARRRQGMTGSQDDGMTG